MTAPAIDMHCHLDLYPDPKLVLEEVGRRKVYVLSVTTTPTAWHGTNALAAGNARVKTALGLHPQLAHERKHELTLFDKLLSDTRYVGEIGLDGSPEYKPHWRDQTKVFDHVLAACARVGGRILTIHSRAAATEVLDALERRSNAGTPILHWFSGSKSELRRAIEMKCWFSVGSAMLKSKNGRELVASMPRERVLTETDGPFGEYAGKALQPADTRYAVDMLSKLWSMSTDDVASCILASFRGLIAS
jgi:TatD DNase family protein